MFELSLRSAVRLVQVQIMREALFGGKAIYTWSRYVDPDLREFFNK